MAALAILASHQSWAQSVTKRLTQRLDTAPLDHHLWGIAVLDQHGKLIFGRNSDRLFIPASNTKLVVAATAAILLPPNFKVRTSVYALGALEGGVLKGDLVLYGRGDPTMSRRCFAIDTTAARSCEADPTRPFAELAAALAGRGLQAVDGDIIGDGSYFEAKTVHGTWENDDLIWWYAAPVSGLGFNDNSVDVTIRPGATIGAPAVIEVWPQVADLAFENRTETVSPEGRTDL
ncbi:MAG: D-alanyl-D-alanine carboxypeptidase, partial [Gemmatimonadota bacterium]